MTICFVFDLYQPPKIRSFISSVTAASLENIEEPLKNFVWEFDKVILYPSSDVLLLVVVMQYDLCLFFVGAGRFPSLG